MKAINVDYLTDYQVKLTKIVTRLTEVLRLIFTTERHKHKGRHKSSFNPERGLDTRARMCKLKRIRGYVFQFYFLFRVK